MLLVMDIGNSRVKWARVDVKGNLEDAQSCLNADLANTVLKRALKGVKKVLIANVAGDAMAEQVQALLPQSAQVTFVTAQAHAAGVVNNYQPNSLGADRWAALVAAWAMHGQPTVVVNAGTAITIDALARERGTKNGVFVGGMIMPGLRLMMSSLGDNTALLKPNSAGRAVAFPISTQDALQTGCMSAVVGAISLMMQQLEKHSAFLPKLVVSGGDATKVAEALAPHIKRVIIAENLVLQGLVLINNSSD